MEYIENRDLAVENDKAAMRATKIKETEEPFIYNKPCQYKVSGHKKMNSLTGVHKTHIYTDFVYSLEELFFSIAAFYTAFLKQNSEMRTPCINYFKRIKKRSILK